MTYTKSPGISDKRLWYVHIGPLWSLNNIDESLCTRVLLYFVIKSWSKSYIKITFMARLILTYQHIIFNLKVFEVVNLLDCIYLFNDYY